MTTTTAAATKLPAPKTTANKATDATPSAHPMAPKPMWAAPRFPDRLIGGFYAAVCWGLVAQR